MTKKKIFILLLAVLIISLTACVSEEKPSESPDTSADMSSSKTTVVSAETTEVESTTTSSASAISNENKTYIAFPDMSREKEQKINQWILETSRAECAFCYDTYSDSYYFSWQNRLTNTFNATGGLYKMDGKTRVITKLSDDAAYSLKIHDDWLYFINSAEFNMLFKMRLDGTERQRVTDMTVCSFDIVGDKIVLSEIFFPKFFTITRKYDVFSMKFRRLSQIDLDGSGHEIVSEIQHFPIMYMEPYICA